MDRRHEFSKIDAESVACLLEQYPSIVPPKLTDLDSSRYESIPSILASRKTADDSHLTKSELVTLVDWKLSHGIFRPSLKALVNQNGGDTIETITRDALSTFDASSVESAKKSLNALIKMKGIGPATASLVLSVYDPDNAPFFSDELFRWVFWEEGTGKGWDRQIKYTLKEYLELFERVQDRVSEGTLKAVDLERSAYVLGKTAAGKEGNIGKNAAEKGATQGGSQPKDKKRKVKSEDADDVEPLAKKSRETPDGTQKKTKPTREQTAGTRSSTRLKKS